MGAGAAQQHAQCKGVFPVVGSTSRASLGSASRRRIKSADLSGVSPVNMEVSDIVRLSCTSERAQESYEECASASSVDVMTVGALFVRRGTPWG